MHKYFFSLILFAGVTTDLFAKTTQTKTKGSRISQQRSPLSSSKVSSSDHPGKLGAGIILGNPTGFSFKTHLHGREFMDFALAYSLRSSENFHVHGDYLWQKPHSFEIDQVPMFTYWGVGARFKNYRSGHHKDDYALGVRFPLGMGYIVGKSSFELFAELAFIMDILESTDVDFDIALGARFWF